MNVLLIVLATTILINLPLIDEILEDATDFKLGIHDTHKRDVWVRAGLLLIASFFCGLLRWGDSLWLSIGACYAYGTGWYILTFDYALNRIRGKRWDHVGQEEESADTDKIIAKFNPYVMLGLKFSAFISGVLFYIFL